MAATMIEPTGARSEPSAQPHPLAIIQAAVERGMDPDQLGKLMDLQERYERSRAIEAFNQALNRVQQSLPIVLRDAKGAKSRYAKLESVNRIIKPVYTGEGFSLSFSTEDAEAGTIRISATLLHSGGHEKKYVGPSMPIDGTGAKGGQMAMTELQGHGSTISYGRRYLTCLIFDVTIADEDNDGNGPTISPPQIESINRLIEEIRAAGKPFDFQKFLAWLGVKSLDELPQSKVAKALMELNRKRTTK